MSRKRNVSNCATRHIERLGIDTRRPHMSQYAPACKNSRNWLAVALVHEVRSNSAILSVSTIGFAPPDPKTSPVHENGANPKEFEPSAQAIRNWVAQADRDEGRREDGLTTAEREELNRLRRENRQLKLEREILSKAAAWFARETDVIPPKGSNS